MTTANVVDLSHHDADPDFDALRERGIWAIIHKATEGHAYVDPKFHHRVEAAHDAGLLTGAYHFITSGDVEAQLENYWGQVTLLPQDFLGCHVVDFESNGRDTAGLNQLYEFMTLLDRRLGRGKQCVIYSSALIRETLKDTSGHVHAQMSGIAGFMRNHRLWLAEYGPHENIPWPWSKAWLWQFSGGTADLNHYAGTQAQLIDNWLT